MAPFIFSDETVENLRDGLFMVLLFSPFLATMRCPSVGFSLGFLAVSMPDKAGAQ